MNEIILVDPEKCVGCNACVRNCPAPEANITKKIDNTHFITTVNPEKCITCGECVRTCEHGARDYIDDTKTFMDNCSAKKMIVLVTPAIKSIFPNTWKSILDYFKKKGICIIEWSDMISDILPSERLDINFQIVDENTRIITLVPHGEKYEELVSSVI